MSRIIIHAHAKINLSIDIKGKRPDGYHELISVMQSVSLFDRIIINTCKKGVTVQNSLPFLPSDNRNLAVKAAESFFAKSGISDGLQIYIDKLIPVGAGLGGGSTDAAAVLYALNKKYNNILSEKDMYDIALSCGADVPFCMHGGTCLCEGIGEVLTPLSFLPNCYIVIVKPSFSINTKKVYQALSVDKITKRPNTDKLIASLKNNDLDGVCDSMYNVLQPVVNSEYPKISHYCNVLKENGAKKAIMSGSGSSVFGIFTSENDAKKAHLKFQNMHITSFITTPVSNIF